MGSSTGPRTARGKSRSSQNAAKHWIGSGRILPEEQKQAAILRSGFAGDFKPEGLSENEVIDDLTLNRLIKRRIDIAFTREFSKAAIEKEIRLLDDVERTATQYWFRFDALGGKYRPKGEMAERVRPDLCISALGGLTDRITNRGPQPQDLETLSGYYGDQPTEHAALAMHLLTRIAEKREQSQNVETVVEAEAKRELLETLQTEIEVQRDRGLRSEAILAAETASQVQEPARPELDKLLRYRSANTREFKDLLSILESIRRLQG